MAQNNLPRSIGHEREWYVLWRSTTLPRRHSEIMSTPLQGHPALISAFEPILLVTMPRVAETLKSVIDEMRYGTNSKLFTIVHTDDANITHDVLNTDIEQNWNIHRMLCDTITSRAKPLSKGQLSHC